MTKQEALQRYFGYSCFRSGQETIIDALLAGKDALAVMPTGSGKSLCYQIPSLLLPGITLVFSPLLSLMQDQVTQLVQMGIPAAYFNSSLTPGQYRLALRRAEQGWYKIIYVAPERLQNNGFLHFAHHARISLLAVDEAHCISQWGQDFRPAYQAIPEFSASLAQRPVIGAFTATATPNVREDIIEQLHLYEPLSVTTGFNRENLYFETREIKNQDKPACLLDIIQHYSDQCGIVYCSTRKTVEEVCTFLQENYISAGRYHAGLNPEERKQSQEDFINDRIQVIVATNAFGMGIDKSNVRYVLHYNMPKDVESYYQEAGRAGRDGLPASCILLYNGQDVRTGEFLITHGEERQNLTGEIRQKLRERDLQRLRIMSAYCHTTNCLRQYILKYFGESSSGFCGGCFNCLHNFQQVDITRDARKIIHCVTASGQRYGISAITDTLRGVTSNAVQKYGLDSSPEYGALQKRTRKEIRERIDFLIEQEYLLQSPGEYPVLCLGRNAGTFLSESTPLWMKTAGEESKKKSILPKIRADAAFDDEQKALWEKLRKLRLSLAREQGVPAYVIFHDKTLRDLVFLQPDSLDTFRAIGGIGEEKTRRYGKDFIAAIQQFKADSKY